MRFRAIEVYIQRESRHLLAMINLRRKNNCEIFGDYYNKIIESNHCTKRTSDLERVRQLRDAFAAGQVKPGSPTRQTKSPSCWGGTPRPPSGCSRWCRHRNSCVPVRVGGERDRGERTVLLSNKEDLKRGLERGISYGLIHFNELEKRILSILAAEFRKNLCSQTYLETTL